MSSGQKALTSSPEGERGLGWGHGALFPKQPPPKVEETRMRLERLRQRRCHWGWETPEAGCCSAGPGPFDPERRTLGQQTRNAEERAGPASSCFEEVLPVLGTVAWISSAPSRSCGDAQAMLCPGRAGDKVLGRKWKEPAHPPPAWKSPSCSPLVEPKRAQLVSLTCAL